ncbi:MAG: GNAT family N-acetyltransferase [Lachnospiraceae bacterium]|nr:GNAT family N-acetyltransferase [Lachnospiraceae bacterium]
MKAGKIRIATEQDAEALLEIYAPYVENTAITFEYTVPTLQEFTQRMRHVLEKYPYLVAEREGIIAGYAYAGTFKERAAYDWSVENTVYVREGQKKTGVGRELYEMLEKLLALQNIQNLNACIAYLEIEDQYLTHDSVQFHEHLGYRLVGEFYKCGYKNGRWYNMVWMEKHIGGHEDRPQAVKLFDDVRELAAEKYRIF